MLNILSTPLLVNSVWLHCTSLNLRSLLNAFNQRRWLCLDIYSVLRYSWNNGHILGLVIFGSILIGLKGIVRFGASSRVLWLLFWPKLLNPLLSKRLSHIPERHRWRELKIMRHLKPVVVGIKLDVSRTGSEHFRLSGCDARILLVLLFLHRLSFVNGLLNILKEAEIW